MSRTLTTWSKKAQNVHKSAYFSSWNEFPPGHIKFSIVQCTHIPHSVFYPLNVCGYWWCGCSVKNIYLQIIIQTQLLFGIQRARWWKMCSVHKQQTFSLSLIPNKIQFRVQFSSQIGNECWTFLTCNVCLSNAPSISSQQHPTVLERVWKMISKINSREHWINFPWTIFCKTWFW